MLTECCFGRDNGEPCYFSNAKIRPHLTIRLTEKEVAVINLVWIRNYLYWLSCIMHGTLRAAVSPSIEAGLINPNSERQSGAHKHELCTSIFPFCSHISLYCTSQELFPKSSLPKTTAGLIHSNERWWDWEEEEKTVKKINFPWLMYSTYCWWVSSFLFYLWPIEMAARATCEVWFMVGLGRRNIGRLPGWFKSYLEWLSALLS